MYQLLKLTKRLAISEAPLTWALAIKLAVALVLISSFSGCGEPQQAPPAKKDTGIINKVTDDIGEAKPGAEQADLQAKGLGGVYGFAASEAAQMQIKPAIEMYRAETGEYPKDYDEFMNKIVKRHGIKRIKLPVLPGERQYQYDVKNHKLIVVEKEQTAKEQTE